MTTGIICRKPRRNPEEVLAHVDIVDFIVPHVELKKAGTQYKGACCFHQERTPSFYVSRIKQAYYCLSGETRVITANGTFDIKSLAGSGQRIVAPDGTWADAYFSSYGQQKIWEIKLTRNGKKKTIRATREHRWFVHGRKTEVITSELHKGHRLESRSTTPSKCRLDPEGVRHGIVFGDGTKAKNSTGGHVVLHDMKSNDLSKWFPDHNQYFHELERGGAQHYATTICGRFAHMKEMPSLIMSDEYLAGFLAGYLATDGHVAAKDADTTIACKDKATLDKLRDICTKIGVMTYSASGYSRLGFGKVSDLFQMHFCTESMWDDLFIRPQQSDRIKNINKKYFRKRWVVEDVYPTEIVEEVYCANVPVHHAFVLEDNILTGNCFGCGAGGDAISFVRMMYSLDFHDALDFLAGSPVAHAEPIQRDTRHAEQDERERRYLAERAAKEAAELLRTSSKKHHDYLALKGQGLASALTKEYVHVTEDNTMLVPMYLVEDYNKIAGLQRIEWLLDEEDNKMKWIKRYTFGSPGHGVIFYIGSTDFPETIFCEGFATGLSLKCAVGPMKMNIGVCFSAGNLLKVAQMTNGPGRYVFADNDKSGTGQKFAEQTGLPWIMPPTISTDANDMHQKHGVIALRALILKLRKFRE